MADVNDANHHVIEIPVAGDHQKQIIFSIQDHPLMEISESPGHLLLLNLWQRQQHLFCMKITQKETQLNTLQSEIFHLCLFFLTFHGFFLTILFTSTTTNINSCHKWWIPTVLSLLTSCMMVFLVQLKLCRYWKVGEQMQRERTDCRSLMRCVQELRMKGASFDLSKEPGIGNKMKMKSSSVEIKWKPLTWCSKYFITVCLVGVSGLAVAVCRFMVCI